jgi:hypothetical protein
MPDRVQQDAVAVARGIIKAYKGRGWTTGMAVRPDGSMCLLVAMGCLETTPTRERRFGLAFGGWIGTRALAKWNDGAPLPVPPLRPSPTSKKELINTLTEFIKDMEAA